MAVQRKRNIGVCDNRVHDWVAKFFKYSIRDKKWFQTAITFVICIAGVLVGVQTYDVTSSPWVDIIAVMEEMVVTIFVVEIVVKVIAEGRFPWRFFWDGWNVFDFLIVVAGFLPFAGSAVTALRLVRLLRVLKLVRALPKLRILVMGLLKSLSSIAYIGLLLMLLFYLYAVLGVLVLGNNDPIHMGTLHIAFLTLFRCATLEDWTDVMYIGMEGCDNYGYDGNEDLCANPSASPIMSVTYFCSFIILSSMMILNLFIGVITSSMADAKSDLSEELENEKAAKQDQPEEMVLGRLLRDLGEIIDEVTSELDTYADLERERQSGEVIQLSHRNVHKNVEMDRQDSTATGAQSLRRDNFHGQLLDTHVVQEVADTNSHGGDGQSPAQLAPTAVTSLSPASSSPSSQPVPHSTTGLVINTALPARTTSTAFTPASATSSTSGGSRTSGSGRHRVAAGPAQFASERRLAGPPTLFSPTAASVAAASPASAGARTPPSSTSNSLLPNRRPRNGVGMARSTAAGGGRRSATRLEPLPAVTEEAGQDGEPRDRSDRLLRQSPPDQAATLPVVTHTQHEAGAVDNVEHVASATTATSAVNDKSDTEEHGN